MPDIVFYEGKPYNVAGVKGAGMFEPRSFGLKSMAKCSDCWRGYVCEYCVLKDRRFVLRGLRINLPDQADDADEDLELFGVKPRHYKNGLFERSYRGMNGPIEFTGGILLGMDFISKLYVHMGFHPAWKYQKVYELILEKGRVVSAEDRSQRMAELREEISRESLTPKSSAEIAKWVETCFSLEYR